MRIRHLAIFALLTLAALAQAQTPSTKADKTNDEKSQLWFAQTAAVIAINTPVSYTHLTLPTIYSV